MAAIFLLPLRSAAQQAPGDEHPGKAPYDRWCAECHGFEGRGDGAAAGYMLPRPRDFTRALYQIRSTPSGAMPTDDDLMHIIDEGMPGTAMPGWTEQLSGGDRRALVEYLKTFSPFFEDAAAEPIDAGGAPRMGDDDIAAGRELYERLECWKCHGDLGRGDGTSAPTQEDEAGFPIRPADLSENWLFNGGGSVEQIYTRLITGLNGTPMPSLGDVVQAGVASEEDIWKLAHYVRGLSPEREPRPREVIRAALVDATLPASPGDSIWAEVERFYVPLVGQIIVKPRRFAPTVDGVWVQALHNGEELVVRLVWHDPSRSPDPIWNEWQQSVVEHMEPKEDTLGSAALADAFAVQFPTTRPTGMELPYFLLGSERSPVYLWRWQSEPEQLGEAIARGHSQIEPLAGAAVSGEAVFDRGEWRLLLRRSLVPADSVSRFTFTTGEALPIAFFAWDGSNGEAGPPGSVSSWYYLYLAQPTSATVYAVPVIVTIMTALLGLYVVARAQRRERAANAGRAPAPIETPA
ncbi:MAG: c-type cytochrome [Longimicrobiales bacterium]